ncbi:MAG TPA: PKD domain-containing protein [Thermoplasmata archaeon]|nr:PKD domain-containing protein [Thermoplasmata archaeon]
MDSERAGVLTGVIVLVIGVALLGVTFDLAYGLAHDPAGFVKSEDKDFSSSAASGLTASFVWGSNDYTVSFTDTSADNGSTITSWVWGFGDGTTYSGESPPSHTYSTTCTNCVENVSLTVTDVAGHQSIAQAAVEVQQTGTSGGVGQPTSSLSSLFSGFGGSISSFLAGLTGPFVATLLLLIALGVMVAVGSALTRAGWNLIRPAPETVKIRVRPKSLLKEWEFVPEQGLPGAPASVGAAGPGLPPGPTVGSPPATPPGRP